MDVLHTARPIACAALPARPGCYVLSVQPESVGDLGIGLDPDEPVLYVGKAEDSIRRRVQGTHLLDRRTGSSTLRRSVGALLRESLSLQPVPRSSNRKDGKRFVNYAFGSASECALSGWIADNVLVTAVPSQDPARTEAELIRSHRPPLNLTGWDNPHRRPVRELRAECRALAESSERRAAC